MGNADSKSPEDLANGNQHAPHGEWLPDQDSH